MQPVSEAEMKWWAWIVAGLIGFLSSAFGAGVAAEVFRGRMRRLEENDKKQDEKIEYLEADIVGRLYDSDHQARFVVVNDCHLKHTDCKNSIEKKLDDLRSDVKLLINFHMDKGNG